jgi:hypothetical protein
MPGGDGSPDKLGMPSPSNKEVKDTISESQTEPPEMFQDIKIRK